MLSMVVSDRAEAAHSTQLKQRVADRAGTFYFALDQDGSPIALAVLVEDSKVARLAWMISKESDVRSASRYLLSADVFMDAARRGIEYIFMDCALFVQPGLASFQRTLGFDVYTLRISRSDKPVG